MADREGTTNDQSTNSSREDDLLRKLKKQSDNGNGESSLFLGDYYMNYCREDVDWPGEYQSLIDDGSSPRDAKKALQCWILSIEQGFVVSAVNSLSEFLALLESEISAIGTASEKRLIHLSTGQLIEVLRRKSASGCSESSLFLGDLYAIGGGYQDFFNRQGFSYDSLSTTLLFGTPQEYTPPEMDMHTAMIYWQLAVEQDDGRVQRAAKLSLSEAHVARVQELWPKFRNEMSETRKVTYRKALPFTRPTEARKEKKDDSIKQLIQVLERQSENGCAESSLFLGDLYMHHHGRRSTFYCNLTIGEKRCPEDYWLHAKYYEYDVLCKDETKAMHYWSLAVKQDTGRVADAAFESLVDFHKREYATYRELLTFCEVSPFLPSFKPFTSLGQKARSIKAWQKRIGGVLPDLDCALRDKAIRLVKSTWILNYIVSLSLFDFPMLIMPCQALPDVAFFSYDELRERGVPSILAISHMWLSPQHPDPFGDTLFLIAKYFSKAMSTENPKESRSDSDGLPVFWDYASLYQKPRSEEQDTLFRQGLKALGSLYSCKDTRVISIADFPDRTPRIPSLPGYEERGWCFTEMCWANLTAEDFRRPPERLTYSTKPLRSTSTVAPLVPDRFAQRLGECHFTNEKTDRERVIDLHKHHLRRFYEKTTKLDWTGRGWDEARLQDAMEVIANGYTPHLKELMLGGNRDITHVGCNLIAQAIALGTRLEKLSLACNNQVGDEGVQALCPVLSRVKSLDLYGCNISAKGCKTLVEGLLQAETSSSSVKQMNLSGNKDIGDAGLAEICRLFHHPLFGGLKDVKLDSCGCTENGLDHLWNALQDTRAGHAGELCLHFDGKCLNKEVDRIHRCRKRFAKFAPQISVEFKLD